MRTATIQTYALSFGLLSRVSVSTIVADISAVVDKEKSAANSRAHEACGFGHTIPITPLGTSAVAEAPMWQAVSARA